MDKGEAPLGLLRPNRWDWLWGMGWQGNRNSWEGLQASACGSATLRGRSMVGCEGAWIR